MILIFGSIADFPFDRESNALPQPKCAGGSNPLTKDPKAMLISNIEIRGNVDFPQLQQKL